jgi:hypothetical protein
MPTSFSHFFYSEHRNKLKSIEDDLIGEILEGLYSCNLKYILNEVVDAHMKSIKYFMKEYKKIPPDSANKNIILQKLKMELEYNYKLDSFIHSKLINNKKNVLTSTNNNIINLTNNKKKQSHRNISTSTSNNKKVNGTPFKKLNSFNNLFKKNNSKK